MKTRALVRFAALASSSLLSTALLAQATTNPATPMPKRTLETRSDQRLDNWWNDAVFYQIFLRSWKDSSVGPKANDGIGDFQGLIDTLDYLNDGNPDSTSSLGVRGIWLMPIFEGPSYHGYETEDYYKIESDFGNNEDFKRFVQEAEKRGIRVILDLVLNHTGKTHPWFTQNLKPGSPKHDWFIWSETKPTWKGPWGQEVWWDISQAPGGEALKRPGGGPFFYGIFSYHMPDLNYRNPEVTAEMNKVTDYWIQQYGVAGYRLDAIRHLVEDGAQQENTPGTHEWLRAWHKHYKKTRPDAFTIGEVWSSTDIIASYVPDQMDTCFEFDVSYATIDAVNNADAKRIREAAAKAFRVYPRNQYGTFLSNHDQTRVMTRFGNDFSKMRLAASMLLTQPGIPFLYYGEEVGQVGDKPDENLRTPMQWSDAPNAGFSTVAPWMKPQSDYTTKNVKAQSSDPSSLLNLYRRLIRLRNDNVALRTGDFRVVEPVGPGADKVYAFARSEKMGSADDAIEQNLLIVANLSDRVVRGVSFSLKEGGFRKAGEVGELLHGTAVSSSRPLLNGRGGFSDFRPLDELAPRTLYVIEVK